MEWNWEEYGIFLPFIFLMLADVAFTVSFSILMAGIGLWSGIGIVYSFLMLAEHFQTVRQNSFSSVLSQSDI